MTRRTEVEAALSAENEFVSAQTLHARMRASGSNVGLTTVYRSLQRMVDEGRSDTLMTADAEALYRTCTPSHHHHLVCRTCGRTVEVDAPEIERWARKVAATHDFSELTHTVEVFGTCSSCAARASG
jgi:Fur family ferric uptake transcriptional regulator